MKTSAAWLIEQAGFGKGYGAGAGPDLDQAHPGPDQPGWRHAPTTCSALAREIRAGVQGRFGVTLVNEPVLVGVGL